MTPEDRARCITGWCKDIHGMDPSIPNKHVSHSAPLYLILGGSHELKITLQDVKEILGWKRTQKSSKAYGPIGYTGNGWESTKPFP